MIEEEAKLLLEAGAKEEARQVEEARKGIASMIEEALVPINAAIAKLDKLKANKLFKTKA